ncbi:hypothetical protein HNP84_009262 [Thermocatellispora tengchongensis]|uniref:Uncharacterized protein n=1 Tax=Thermocatellispora tengchongensis TaxID=1073253 RepID=A0A840PKM6_9ACTN|nr:choice-of-anchor P family protein [Thermocatellispora tengchongensis]MBB5139499.1 hypothetical protein [Thermocatellispora tengchongensis]
MGIRRNLLAASALVVGAAAVLVGAATMSQAAADETPGVPGTAYGLSAEGPVRIQPIPAAVSRDGKTVHRSVLRPKNPLVSASAMEVTTNGRNSQASAADVSTLQRQVAANAVSARCENGRGVSNLAGAVIGGRDIDANPAPNTTIPVTIERVGTASVTLNKQVRQADGRLAVTGLSIDMPMSNGKRQTIDVASVVCGTPTDASSTNEASGDMEGPLGDMDDSGRPRETGDTITGPTRDVSTQVQQERVEKQAPAPIPAKVNLPVAG